MTTDNASVIDETQLKTSLLATVADIAPIIRASAARSESTGTLAPEAVQCLREAGLWRMRLMRELDGYEASIATQIAVLAALAEIDTASAWCTMVANNGVGTIGAFMPDDGIAEIFSDGVPACAGVAAPSGKAIPVPDGYLVTGTWRFASGIRHADWVIVSTFVDGDPARPLTVALQTPKVQIHDTWQVLGLRGTGSCDFSTDALFVPTRRSLPGSERTQLRGQRLYARSGMILAVYEHLAVALGVGRRALRELILTLSTKTAPGSTGDREVVQMELSRLTLQLDAVETTAMAYYSAIDALTGDSDPSMDRSMAAKGRALATWATEIASECVNISFRRAGARSLYVPNEFEQLKRDIAAAQAHVLVNDTAYAAHGAALIEAVVHP